MRKGLLAITSHGNALYLMAARTAQALGDQTIVIPHYSGARQQRILAGETSLNASSIFLSAHGCAQSCADRDAALHPALAKNGKLVRSGTGTPDSCVLLYFQYTDVPATDFPGCRPDPAAGGETPTVSPARPSGGSVLHFRNANRWQKIEKDQTHRSGALSTAGTLGLCLAFRVFSQKVEPVSARVYNDPFLAAVIAGAAGEPPGNV